MLKILIAEDNVDFRQSLKEYGTFEYKDRAKSARHRRQYYAI